MPRSTNELPLFAQEPVETGGGWTELGHDGARYRYRLRLDRHAPHEMLNHAPGTIRFQLQKLLDGEWKDVNFYRTRDAIWERVTGESVAGRRADHETKTEQGDEDDG